MAPTRRELRLTFSSLRRDRGGRGGHGAERVAGELRVEAVVEGTTHGGAATPFVSPFGPLESDSLRWYLEIYPGWPFGTFHERAVEIEAILADWGRDLLRATLGGHGDTFRAWVDGAAGDRELITVRAEGERALAAELLALPWEILADEGGFLFDPPVRCRVRRQLAGGKHHEHTRGGLPLRVLLVVSRPEAEGLSFIDPRATALPLSDALAPLGDAVELTVLPDGTLDGLRDALDEAQEQGRPFAVVHFDGHGVVDEKGTGQLCFEYADDVDTGQVTRRVALVDAATFGELLSDRGVTLVFLEACQTAAARGTAPASVAVSLLECGVGSVVAMSHVVRAASTRRFVDAFYRMLGQGRCISAAMAAAQSALRLHTLQDRLGEPSVAGTAPLQDWFVPVLYQQEEGDAALLPEDAWTGTPPPEEPRGDPLPPSPEHGFVGRAWDLTVVQRHLRTERWLTLLGDGGQGKTALAVEAARWLRRTGAVGHVGFVSVEQYGEARTVLDTLGSQLVPGYSVARVEGTGTPEERLLAAMIPLLDALAATPTLLVVDNLESVLPRPAEAVPPAVTELLTMLEALSRAGETRLLLTSRQIPPRPLDRNFHRLAPLSPAEGKQLVARILQRGEVEPAREGHEDETWIEKLVEAVGGHPRSLVLLAPLVAQEGLETTAGAMVRHMTLLEERHPGQRETSLLASVRLSLGRLSAGTRTILPRLALFHGGIHPAAMAGVLGIDVDGALEVCRELVEVGLADADGPYLLPDPALRSALALELPPWEWADAEYRWMEVTIKLGQALYDQQFEEARQSAQGTVHALPDLLAALHELERQVEGGLGVAARATAYATCLEQLVSHLGRPRVLDEVVEVRRRLSQRLDTWSHDGFAAEGHEVMRLLQLGDIPTALERAYDLLEHAEAAGDAYPEARYDRAMAQWLLGRALVRSGQADAALAPLRKAEASFSDQAAEGLEEASRMASVALAEQGDALRHLGRLEDAAIALRRAIALHEERGDQRQLAEVRVNLGIVRIRQGRTADALETFHRARALFEELDDPVAVANTWHQVGTAYDQMDQPTQAESAYQKALRLRARSEDRSGEAVTLVQLGNLYRATDRVEEAVTCFVRAADLAHELGDPLREAGARNNLAESYHALGLLDEARRALRAALQLVAPLGHAAQPWKTWAILYDVEIDAGKRRRAAQAIAQARLLYRAYRVAGGAPVDGATRLVAEVADQLRTRSPLDARMAIPPEEAFGPDALALRQSLLTLVQGSTDPEEIAFDRFPYSIQVEFELALDRSMGLGRLGGG